MDAAAEDSKKIFPENAEVGNKNSEETHRAENQGWGGSSISEHSATNLSGEITAEKPDEKVGWGQSGPVAPEKARWGENSIVSGKDDDKSGWGGHEAAIAPEKKSVEESAWNHEQVEEPHEGNLRGIVSESRGSENQEAFKNSGEVKSDWKNESDEVNGAPRNSGDIKNGWGNENGASKNSGDVKNGWGNENGAPGNSGDVKNGWGNENGASKNSGDVKNGWDNENGSSKNSGDVKNGWDNENKASKNSGEIENGWNNENKASKNSGEIRNVNLPSLPNTAACHALEGFSGAEAICEKLEERDCVQNSSFCTWKSG